jgi:eukaryotic-like serine/threonine-protein kinase
LTSQRWRQIEALYHSACERGAAVLDGADPEVRREVEKLLAQDSVSGPRLLDQSAADLIRDLAEAPVSPGARLGPYQIEALLGKGGMGQVFRATDTRLTRRVAIKICNKPFLDRFEQEARSIAAISHPNVCTLYDVGPNYLVMELLDGETLAARLKRGKLPINDTLRFGAQIAEALAVAHAAGIIHRDLKPGNIMLSKSGIKVLDFGLAKSGIDPSLTAPGGVMGTPAYLAPERLEGIEADPRSDIYALGLILAEMATGKRTQQPDKIPPQLERLIQRCIQPDPDERWQSARDVKWELESIADAPRDLPARKSGLLLAAALTLIAVIAAATAFILLRPARQDRPVTRSNILLPENSRVLSLALSPDGHYIAAVLLKDGKQQIWVRSLDSLDMTPLSGTDNAADPFWSPDNRFIAFMADAKLKKVARSGGPVQILCDALGVLGGSWNRDGTILMGGLSRVQRVSEDGGPLSDLPGAAITKVFPSILPDGHHFLALQGSLSEPAQVGVWLNSIDGPESQRLLPDASNAELLPPPPGSNIGTILFSRSGALMALPFDIKKLKSAGDPVPIAPDVDRGTSRRSLIAASGNETLAWVSGQRSRWQYVWRDRQGRDLGVAGDAGAVAMISPDGTKLVGDREAGLSVLEFAHGTSTRIGFGDSGGFNPVWSPDGRYVAYYRSPGIYRKFANGAGTDELLIRTNTLAVPKSWSPDGRYLIYAQIKPGTGADLLALPLEPNSQPLALAQTPANEDQGQFSPDGRWVAYTSNESGLSEIYVIPFPPAPNAGRWVVSRGGGVQPRWRRDGKELFYISPDWKMMAVDVTTRPVFHSDEPHPLFDSHMVDTGIRTGPISWDIAPDGKRFLIISDNAQGPSSLNLLQNWRPDLAK